MVLATHFIEQETCLYRLNGIVLSQQWRKLPTHSSFAKLWEKEAYVTSCTRPLLAKHSSCSFDPQRFLISRHDPEKSARKEKRFMRKLIPMQNEMRSPVNSALLSQIETDFDAAQVHQLERDWLGFPPISMAARPTLLPVVLLAAQPRVLPCCCTSTLRQQTSARSQPRLCLALHFGQIFHCCSVGRRSRWSLLGSTLQVLDTLGNVLCDTCCTILII